MSLLLLFRPRSTAVAADENPAVAVVSLADGVGLVGINDGIKEKLDIVDGVGSVSIGDGVQVGTINPDYVIRVVN